MASAGTVTIDFAAEVARFTAEMKKVRGEIAGVRTASDATAKSVAALGTGFRNVIGILAAGAGFRAIIKNTAESEAATAQLDTALLKAGVDVKIVSADFQAYAAQLQRVTTVQDEAVLGVETILLSFRGLSGDTIKRATADVLDLSARLGIDLNTAAKSVGKALEDPVEGITKLGKAGVIFTDAQKLQIKQFVEVGDKAKAQAVILKEVEERFKGSAEAARNNFSGALTGLKNAAGDLLEAKGGLPELTGELNKLSDFLNDPVTKQSADSLLSGLVSAASTAVSFLSQTVQGLKIILTREGGNAIVDLDLQIEDLQKKKAFLLSGGGGRASASTLGRAAIQVQMDEIDKQISGLLDKQHQLLNPPPATVTTAPTSNFVTPEATGPSDAEIARQQQLDRTLEQFRQKALTFDADLSEQLAANRDSFIQERLDAEAASRDQIAEGERKLAEYRATVSKNAEIAIQQQKLTTTNLAVTLLQELGSRSKAFAIAAIVVEKALAIQRVLQANAVAAELAFASQLIPGVPATLATAAAAKAAVLASGRIQVGLIAASGLLQIGSTLSGGSPIGSAVNPVFTRNTGDAADGGPQGAASLNAVQVIIAGNVGFDQHVMDQIIAGIREAADDRDVIIFGPNSLQAQQVVAA